MPGKKSRLQKDKRQKRAKTELKPGRPFKDYSLLVRRSQTEGPSLSGKLQAMDGSGRDEGEECVGKQVTHLSLGCRREVDPENFVRYTLLIGDKLNSIRSSELGV